MIKFSCFRVVLVLIFTFALSSMAQIPTNGLLGYWPLDGNANDLSGNGHHGMVTGATSTTGKVGGAYSFNGSASIDVGDIDFSSQAYTIAGWVRTTAPAVEWDYRNWIDKPEGNSGPFMLGIGDGSFQGGYNNPNFTIWQSGFGDVLLMLAPDVNMRDGVWHHMAVSYSLGTAYVYVDGNLLALGFFFSNLPVNNAHILIGGRNFLSSYHPWKGEIDEVRIYDRALSPTEVQALVGTQVSIPTLSIFPGSGRFLSTQKFDFSILLENTTLPVTSLTILGDGVNITSGLVNQFQNGLVSNGRYSIFKDGTVGPGNHTFEVTVQLSDGTLLKQVAHWSVVQTTQ